MPEDNAARDRVGWLGAFVAVLLGGLSAWVMHGWLEPTEPSLAVCATAGGVGGGVVVALADRVLRRPGRVGRWCTQGLMVLLPVGGSVLYGAYRGIAWEVDPAVLPDWATVLGWGFLVGIVPAAIACVLTRYGDDTWGPAGRIVLSLFVWSVVPGGPGWWWLGAHTRGNRDDSCHERIRELGFAMRMYATDHGETMPPVGTTTADLSGAPLPHDTIPNADPLDDRRPGLLYAYLGSHKPWFCPDDHGWIDRLERVYRDLDPKSAASYRWNHALAGKNLRDLPDASKIPALFDREPFHDGARNVAFADGHCATVPEHKFGQYHVEAR